jgi:peptidyl-tRNA hydrolase, PTH2 family
MYSKDNIKFVIVVIKDLDMECGKIAAQVGHACSSVVYNNMDDAYNWVNYSNQKKAILKSDI